MIKDNKAFEILVREHHRRLLAYAHSLVPSSVAEDLVQDAFITAYKKLDSFDSSKSFGAWVRGIIRMKYLEWVRKQNEVSMDNELLDALEASHYEWDRGESSPGNAFRTLRDCIGKLPDRFRELIDLFYMKEKSGRSISQEMNLSEATVRKSLERARKNLAKCISQNMEAENV